MKPLKEALTYMKNIHVTGAVASISDKAAGALAKQVMTRLDDKSGSKLVELGAGTGKISQLLADHYTETELVLIEKLPEFADRLEELVGDQENTQIHQGDLFDLLEDDDFACDIVLSTVPFSFFNKHETVWLCKRIHELLPEGGYFVSGQVRTSQNKDFEEHIGEIVYEKRIWGVQPVNVVVVQKS